MAKNKQIRVKMRNSLHGHPIAIPRLLAKEDAAEILEGELVIRTPIDTGKARQGWDKRELANGDVRVTNQVPYIRRLALDGHSPQARAGYHNDAIRAARSRIKERGESLERTAREFGIDAPAELGRQRGRLQPTELGTQKNKAIE